jgi:hypothetical protein
MVLSAISPENRDPLFRIVLENLKFSFGLSMILSENRFPVFRIMLWTSGSKKEARPKRPGTPYSLRRNIVRKLQKQRFVGGLVDRFSTRIANSTRMEGRPHGRQAESDSSLG